MSKRADVEGAGREIREATESVAGVAATSVASAKTGSVRLNGARSHRRWEGRGRRIPAMKPLRILVVEDDPMIGSVFAEMLEDLGHIVCGARSTPRTPWPPLHGNVPN